MLSKQAIPHTGLSIKQTQMESSCVSQTSKLVCSTLHIERCSHKVRVQSVTLICIQDAAGQLRRSPFQFSGIGGSSPQLFLSLGYAVLDGPTLPIIAEGDEEPNDTYLEQLMAGAKAAVEVSHCYYIALCLY